MRSIAEFETRAAEYDRLASETSANTLRRRYVDLAECYRLLATERRRMIGAGEIEPDGPLASKQQTDTPDGVDAETKRL